MQFLGALSCLVVIALLGLFFFRKWGILDKPGNDLKGTRKPVPTLQGIFVYVIFVTAVCCFSDYGSFPLIQGFLVGGGLIVIVEVITELEYMGRIGFKIPPLVRCCFHIIGACLTLWVSGISGYELTFFGETYLLPDVVLYVLFSVWSVFIINAVNWIDGVNAQGNGILAIGFFTIYLLIRFVVFQSYMTFPNYDLLVMVQDLSLFLALLSLVYTVIEYKPFGLIRDVGTMFLAFGLAYLSLLGGAKFGTLIVTLSLVMFDAIWVGMYRMCILKKNPMNGDYTHLHHRLLGLGWTRGEVRAFVWIFSLVMMVLILLQGTNSLHKLIVFVIMAVLFFGINTYLFIIKKLPCGLNKEKNN